MKPQEKNRCKIQQLFDAGITNGREIARRLGIPERTVYRVSSAILDSKSLSHKKVAGRPRKLLKDDICRILNLVHRNPRITLNECRAKLGCVVAKSTLSNELKRRGLQYRPVVRIPALSPMHITKRLDWYKKMRGQDWSNVLFTDECSIWMNSGKIHVDKERTKH